MLTRVLVPCWLTFGAVKRTGSCVLIFGEREGELCQLKLKPLQQFAGERNTKRSNRKSLAVLTRNCSLLFHKIINIVCSSIWQQKKERNEAIHTSTAHRKTHAAAYVSFFSCCWLSKTWKVVFSHPVSWWIDVFVSLPHKVSPKHSRAGKALHCPMIRACWC